MNRLLRINLLFFIFVFTAAAGYGQVAVNIDNSSPDASAMLDVESVTSGFLIPRMSADARTGITNPATGLLVYQTETPSGFYYYNGIQWNRLSEAYTETDPFFSGWNKSLGISISSSQVSNFSAAVSAVPTVVTNAAKNTYPATDATKLMGIEAGAEVNVNADWNAVSGDAMILNKPASSGIRAPVNPAANSLICYDGSNWVAKTLSLGIAGTNSPINNYQPYLPIRFCMKLFGIFPSRNSYDAYIGEICMFPYDFDPKYFASCNGQLMAIAQNTALFSLLGTFYGGNGTQTFALPDLRGRASFLYGTGPGLSSYSIGQTSGQPNIYLDQTHLPLHTHSIIFN